jgi:glutamate transport system permease protein
VIIAQLVVTLKDTALGFIITYPELLYFAKQLGSNAVLGSPLIPSAIVAGAIYITMCLLLSLAAMKVEQRLRRSPKAGDTPGGAAPLLEGTDTELIVTQKGE